MRLHDLRLLYLSNQLQRALAVKNPNGEGWLLECESVTGKRFRMRKSRGPAGNGRVHPIRVFKRLDSAAQAAIDIGFPSVEVLLPTQAQAAS